LIRPLGRTHDASWGVLVLATSSSIRLNRSMSSAPVTRTRLRSFHELMQNRIQRILLISSLYDSFIMSEEGQLHETLLSHFIDLNLSSVPDLVQVPNGEAALEALRADGGFDLVIASLNTGDGDAASLAEALRAAGFSLPVIGLAYTSRELHEFVLDRDTSVLDRIFLWQGDVRILLAMVMYLEDRLNVENDTGVRGVPAIIVVEDSIRFYSSFLPAIYSELFRHTHRLLSEGLNVSQRMMRMRARPKVLLCETYEEAWAYFERYEEQVLGVVSDFEFRRDGRMEPQAGLDLCSRVLAARSDVRIVLQSSDPANAALADEVGASFLLKGSPHLLHQLQEVLVERFGFGDFIFRLPPDRKEIDRAGDLHTLAKKLATVPSSCVAYHAERNHFSNWLKARTEFALAEKLRPTKASEFASVDDLRAHLLERINEAQVERQRTVIVDFDRNRFEPSTSLTRIGAGSLGGKARGVAFANRILRDSGLDRKYDGVEVYVPPAVVLGTQIFDQFFEYFGLLDYVIGEHPDELITAKIVEAPFPQRAGSDLRAFLQRVHYPLAVRSSSLLEDSLSQPFAGVYQTYMLPNNDPDLDVRWKQLVTAVKRVYASAFVAKAKGYLSMTSYRLEEEKMAVMIQELVGVQHDDRFYPDFGGVARSYNFYPEPGHRAEDGVVAVALGLGRTVVDGSPCLRFCPAHPRQIVSLSSVKDALASSQREFIALYLRRDAEVLGALRRYPLELAEHDGPLMWLGSTYSADDNRIVDGISRDGVRIVSFAHVLKHEAMPLAALLRDLLVCCSEGTGGPVEIEFAGKLPLDGRPARFAFLQLRPLALSRQEGDVSLEGVDEASVLCRSPRILGNGLIEDIHDIVVVDIERFERDRSPEIALQVGHYDAVLRKERRPYLLIGVGRWGSADSSLGIPVGWNQIAGARVIVEAGFKDLTVAPSQGTHFFQNLSSCSVGYFTVNPDQGDGRLDWEWLAAQPAVGESQFVRHLRLASPLVVKMSARAGEGVILKPE
jgi:CheY-like chemotaxis protein